MLEVIICDDMPDLIENLSAQLKSLAEANGLSIHIRSFLSGEALTFHLEENPEQADIIFLDVLMDKMNGIEAARRLRSYGCHASIIFLTSTMEYVFDSFDVEPLHYLLKDNTSLRKLQEVLFKAVKHAEANKNRYFLCEIGRETKQIPINEIAYFEIINRIVTVYFSGQSLEFYGKLSVLEEQLASQGFIRIHRSFLVNARYIDTLSATAVLLADGTELPVGTSFYHAARLAFTQHFFS